MCCTQQSPIAFESESPTRPPQTDHRHGNYQSLFLFEIGGGKNYSREQELDIQIKKIGHDIKVVKAMVMGVWDIFTSTKPRNFKGTQAPIYVHEDEMKHTFYSVATKSDSIHCLTFTFNWYRNQHSPLPWPYTSSIRHAGQPAHELIIDLHQLICKYRSLTGKVVSAS